MMVKSCEPFRIGGAERVKGHRYVILHKKSMKKQHYYKYMQNRLLCRNLFFSLCFLLTFIKNACYNFSIKQDIAAGELPLVMPKGGKLPVGSVIEKWTIYLKTYQSI